MPSHILGRLGGVPASEVEGPGTFYFGIIDLLQTWTVKKRLERAAKVYLKGKDPHGLSALNPSQYADGFKERVINDIFDSPESLRRRNANMRSSSARRVMNSHIRNIKAEEPLGFGHFNFHEAGMRATRIVTKHTHH